MKANEILSILNHFKNSIYQKVLFNGTWGIGKTKYVLEFKSSHSEVCYISLFGKKDIDSILKEIYFDIVDKAPKSKYKKNLRKVREIINNVHLEFYGLSISIPLIKKLHSALYKELKNKGTYIIIFDDLERKHDDLDIKEVLGLVDSLSIIDNIKTVLIADISQLEDDDEKIFKKYNEKAIDRTYTIEEYADEAPVKILGEEIWEVLSNIANEFNFNNLRTFEKTYLFIEEVLDVIGEELFSYKFTKNDIYRMCFATIFFNIEHKGEMKLLDSENSENRLRNIAFMKNDSGVIEYLNRFILKNSLENVMCKSVLFYINAWYKTGAYSKELIIETIESINNYEQPPQNFYSSEEEIFEVINKTREYIYNLDGSENPKDILFRLNSTFLWCEVFSVDLGISIKKLAKLIVDHTEIDLTKSYYLNCHNLLDFYHESREGKMLLEAIKDNLQIKYYKHLINIITDCFIQKSYDEYQYIKQLNDEIISIIDSSLREFIIKEINDNQYFFPTPLGRITEQQWYWCIHIYNLIKDIKSHWNNENFHNTFISFTNELKTTKQDKMLNHRLDQLFQRI